MTPLRLAAAALAGAGLLSACERADLDRDAARQGAPERVSQAQPSPERTARARLDAERAPQPRVDGETAAPEASNGAAREAQAPNATVPAAVPREEITDPVITAKIRAAILSDPAMTGTDVSVNTDRGAVTLAGNVRSQEQIALASAHAQRQHGVMRVDTQLNVVSQ